MENVLNRILTLNLIATTVVFYVAAKIYLLPHLGRLRPRAVLIPILLLHSVRHLGLMFLTRGATYPDLPTQFAYPAALGDLLTAALAFVAIFLVSRDSSGARPLVWVFNIFGTVDLLVAIALATIYNAPQNSAQHSFALRQGNDRCGGERKDQQLPAQFQSDLGTGKRSRREKITSRPTSIRTRER
jgi:hypothetical protein